MKIGQEKKARQVRLYTTVFFCVLLISAYVVAVVVTRRQYAHIQTTQEELLMQIQLERRVRDTAGTLAELSEERAGVKEFFRTPEDIIAIIEELEGFGTYVGTPVAVLQVQIEDEDPETREGVFVVNVMSEGSWRSISHLLSLLDSLPYQSSLSQVTLDTSGVNEETPQPRWSLRATVRITLKQ